MNVLVALHNLIRWVILILAVFALYRAYRGWLGKEDWTPADRKAGVFFTSALDIQFLLGLILWIFGAWGINAFDLPAVGDAGNRMSTLFFALEHPLTMLVAVVLAHVGTATARRLQDSVARHKRVAIFYTISVLLILLAIPWVQRPLFPAL